MLRNAARMLAAALLLLSIVGRSRADSMLFYQDVDAVTFPGGSIVLQSQDATDLMQLPDDTYQITFSGDAYNMSATQKYDDVLYLPQFNFSLFGSGAAFDFTSGTWSNAGDTVQLDSPDGFLSMSDTNAPLSFNRGALTASLTSSDSVPYVSVGTIGPLQSVPFSFVVDMSTTTPFELDGSFVEPTGVPEPSTLALAALGAIAILLGGLQGARRRALRG